MIRRPLYIAGAVRDEPRRQAILMIVPRPSRLRGAAAALILGDHLVAFQDVVRHYSSHHLLHPVITCVIAVAFTTTHSAHAHEPVLGVIPVCPRSVPSHVAARVVSENYSVHVVNAVRIHNRRVLQLIAATYSIEDSRPVSVPVVFVASRPSALCG